jgi:hypothetical protein
MEYLMTRLKQTIVLMMERMNMQALGLVLYVLSGILSKEMWSFVCKNVRTYFKDVRSVTMTNTTMRQLFIPSHSGSTCLSPRIS